MIVAGMLCHKHNLNPPPLHQLVLKSFSDSSVAVLGKVEMGTLARGQRLIINPGQQAVEVSAIYCEDVSFPLKRSAYDSP